LSIAIKLLRRTTSGAADNGLGTTIKYLRGATGIGLGTSVKYMRRKMRQRPWYHGQVPVENNEQRRWQRSGHHDNVPAIHYERRRGQRPEQISASGSNRLYS
jgi:hypothetical protein